MLIGAFIPFIIIFLLIVVHEIGHFMCAKMLNISTEKICIYPFGGVSKFNMSLNEYLEKELLILLMGPITQFIFYIIIVKSNLFNHYNELIKIYNYTILGFNLLPIYPLDGGRLINILLSYKFSFKRSLKLSMIISYITVFLFSSHYLVKNFSISILIVIIFLIYKINREDNNIKFVYDKFLLERYLNGNKFKKRKNVNTINDFMRNKNHIVKKDNNYYTERDILYKKFNNKY